MAKTGDIESNITLGAGQSVRRNGSDTDFEAYTPSSGTDPNAVHVNAAGEIAAITAKASPVSGDYLLIEDSADANNKKSVTIGDLPTGADANAIHDNVAGEIAAITAKATPVSGDYLIIEDSADSNNKKSITVGDLPTGSGTPSGTVSDETSYGISPGAGASTDYSRGDHTHGSPALSTNTPAAETVGASGAAGSGTAPSKDDHVHAMPGDFVASGASHAAGFVPDPGVTGGTTKFLREDASWQVPPGGGTIGGSSGSTDNAIIRADGTGGSTVQSSAATIDDSGTVNIPTGQTYNINNTPHTHAYTERSGATTDGHLAVWNGSSADSIKDGGAVPAGGGASTTDHFIVGQGGENDTDLSAKVIIPRLSSSPDIRVAGTNDDEFDVTDTSDPMTNWTTLGSPTSHNINSTIKSHYYLSKAAAASLSLVGIYKAATPAFTVTCRISAVTSYANYNLGGLFIGEGTPGKMEVWEIIYDGGPYKIKCEAFTNPTTSAGAGFYNPGFAIQGRTPIYYRIIVASSTNVTYQWSPDGYIWNTVVSARNPGFTVASAGIAASSTSGTVAVELAVDWIRFT